MPNSVKLDLSKHRVLSNDIVSAEEQAKLTPGEVLEILKKGNEDFAANSLTIRNTGVGARAAMSRQYPKAVVVSCLDSRVSVEDIFHRGLGEIFVARVAGNIINEDILGSLEFACKVSGSKLVLVLGHEHCGAIISAINKIELGNVTTLLSKITPAIEVASHGFSGEKTVLNPHFVNAVCCKNVCLALEEIRKKSPILRGMEASGEIMICGAIYRMDTGKVELLDS